MFHVRYMFLTDEILRVDNSKLQSRQQIGDNWSGNIRTDQSIMLKLDNIRVGITQELIEKVLIVSSKKPIEDI